MIPMVGALICLAIVLAFIVFFLATPGYLRRHPDKRGSGSPGSGLMGAAFDNAFHPSAAAAREALDEQQHLVTPAPTPDGDKGISGGRIRIDL
jgi:hypothetical protein